MKKLDILVLFDSAGTPPDDQDYTKEFEQQDWFTEAAVVETLQLMGHEVRMMGIYDDIGILIKEVERKKPDLVFNLTELFMGKAHYDRNIPALLELLEIPYTGCGPDGLLLCNNKALSKKILAYHKIKVPHFHVFRRGRKVWLPARLEFPLVIKPLREEASTGISQASYVKTEELLRERVSFIHNRMKADAIAEEYIPGRELYVGIMGQKKLQAFPAREMKFTKVPDDEPRLATYSAKWDENYRKRWGIVSGFATGISDADGAMISRVCKRAYRVLMVDGYARFDCRLTPENELYILEANANPELAQGDEFADSALKAGCTYDRLLARIINLAFARRKL
ncbi:MAG: hypothetical protein R6V03_03055 [Kiritimatiellia bacterium]